VNVLWRWKTDTVNGSECLVESSKAALCLHCCLVWRWTGWCAKQKPTEGSTGSTANSWKTWISRMTLHCWSMMGMRLENLERTGEKIGLKISSSKTKLLEMNTTSGDLKVNSKDIQSVSQFTHLSSLVTDDYRTDAEMKTRFGKTARAVIKLSKIWNNSSFSIQVKMHLYNSIIVPIVLYGAETWAVTKTMEKRTDSFDSRNLRRIVIIRW